MERYSNEFIADLARLVSHGEKPLDRLMEDLADPVRREHLVETLTRLRQVAAETDSPAKPQRASTKQFSYDDVQTPKKSGTDPKARENLETLREKLAVSPNLRSRRVLLNLAAQLQVPLATRDSMPRIAQKILTSVSAREPEEIAEALDRISEVDKDSTESFMGLANFITHGPNGH